MDKCGAFYANKTSLCLNPPLLNDEVGTVKLVKALEQFSY